MRTKLNDRRFSTTLKVHHRIASGDEIKLLITVGYEDPKRSIPREVFCADFKAGSDNHQLIMDACILLSRLLQHGDTPEDLVRSMCNPPSLIGTIAAVILREQGTQAQLVTESDIESENNVGTTNTIDPGHSGINPHANGSQPTIHG